MTESRSPRASSQGHLAALNAGERSAPGLRPGWNRLEGDVPSARRHAYGLAQDLTAVGSDVYIGRIAAKAARKDRADPDLLMQLLPRSGVNRSEQLWSPQASRHGSYCPSERRHPSILSDPTFYTFYIYTT